VALFTMFAVGVWAALPQGVCVCCMVPIVDCCPQKAAAGKTHGGGCCGAKKQDQAKSCCAKPNADGASLKRCECAKTPVNLFLGTADSTPQRDVKAPVAILAATHAVRGDMVASAPAGEPRVALPMAVSPPLVLRI
jgi:hypothetical protein